MTDTTKRNYAEFSELLRGLERNDLVTGTTIDIDGGWLLS
tara:strand:- start:2570 stop:2689 length:120 start_codon:yes stop_codon:yes gene_type:complete